MNKKRFGSFTIAVLSMSVGIMQTAAVAQPRHNDQRDNHWQGGAENRHWDPSNNYRSGGRYRERRLGRNDDIYRGHDGRYYCRRNDGTTGLVIGLVGGGLLGNAIGGDTLSALLGAGGGALLGRSLDRGRVRCR